jgi:hypothetical protein
MSLKGIKVSNKRHLPATAYKSFTYNLPDDRLQKQNAGVVLILLKIAGFLC